jgi:hypothetical protein
VGDKSDFYQKRAREPAKASKENDPFLTSTSHLTVSTLSSHQTAKKNSVNLTPTFSQTVKINL